MTDPALKTHFPPLTREAWRERVESGLRDSAFEELIHRTEDGLDRGPLRSAADLPDALAALGRTDAPLLGDRAWHIAAPVRDPDLAHANTQLLEDLTGGTSAVRLESGLPLESKSDLKRVLEGVYTDLAPVIFAPLSQNAKRLKLAQSITDLQDAHLCAGLDPLHDTDAIAAALDDVPYSWRLMTIAASDVHERGGTDVQELSTLAATLVAALRRFGTDAACRHLVIELAADRDGHLGIAKFRAARRLILRICDAFGADGAGVPIHAVTSARMMQVQDAWTNLLRVMSAGFGAVIGGADVVTTRPFTDGLGHATPFAHRIARNMQLMMMEESHLGQVTDPAHGSYWHERMSEDLAQAAWRSFQMIETKGGMTAYRESGEQEVAIAAAASARDDRDAPILGVTLHRATDVKAPEIRS